MTSQQLRSKTKSTAWQIPLADRLGVALQQHFPTFCKRLAQLESRVLSAATSTRNIEQAVFITGVPRAGSTILLEIFHSLPQFTTLRYGDFPLLWTPYWSNWLRQRVTLSTHSVERSHGDRIIVNRESPEAFEEPLWSAFFPNLHQQTSDEQLSAATSHPEFEQFYAAHIRKLLSVRNKSRYAAKNNDHVSRLAYLQKICSDARFVIPFREPLAHLASLVKQENLYATAPRAALLHLGHIGHHEFGALRCVAQWGASVTDGESARQRRQLFADQKIAEAWLRTWLAVYGKLLAQAESDKALARAMLWLSYERLCGDADSNLSTLFRFCAVDHESAAIAIAHWRDRLSLPDYYSPDNFSTLDRQLVSRAQDLHQRLLQL